MQSIMPAAWKKTMFIRLCQTPLGVCKQNKKDDIVKKPWKYKQKSIIDLRNAGTE